MKCWEKPILRRTALICVVVLWALTEVGGAVGADLAEIKERGVLRHLGVPYANFVTGTGEGLDVEMVMAFAEYLGVRYEYVHTTWQDVIPDVTGKLVRVRGADFKWLGDTTVKGDIAANGLTILF